MSSQKKDANTLACIHTHTVDEFISFRGINNAIFVVFFFFLNNASLMKDWGTLS